LLRPLVVVIYASFIGLLLASYIAPLQGILDGRDEVSKLEHNLAETREYNDGQRRLAEELNTPAGIERAARERYGMVRPGEEVYIVEE
jgi:cell division protein FtsB